MSEPTSAKEGRQPREEPVRPDFAQRIVNGARLVDLAAEYDIDRHVLSRWLKLPEVTSEIESLRATAREANHRALTALAEAAVHTVGAVMTSAELLRCAHAGCTGLVVCESCRLEQPGALPKDRLKAAEMVLDRTGYPKREVVEHAGSVAMTAPTSEQEAGILDEAAHILEERGHRELAAAVRAAGVA